MKGTKNPKIFLSYSWSNTDIADAIDKDFQAVGIELMRDIRDIRYRTSIKEFMARIGSSDYIIMLISDTFIRSANCMHEVTELLQTSEFQNRILPVLVDSAPIFSAEGRTTYYEYWEKALAQKTNLRQSYPNADFLDEEKKVANIMSHVDEFFSIIKDIKIETYAELKASSYQPIFDIIGHNKEQISQKIIEISNIKSDEEREVAIEMLQNNHPQNFNIWLYKGSVALDNNQFYKARYYLDSAIKIDDTHAVAYNNLGIAYKFGWKDLEKAKSCFEKSIELDENHASAHHNLGILVAAPPFSDDENAERHFKKAISIQPDFRTFLSYGSLLSRDLTRLDEAIKVHETALSINPNSSMALNNLGWLLVAAERFSAAKECFEQCINLDPKYTSSYLNLSNLLLTQYDDTEQAKVYYLKAKELDPSLPRTGLTERLGL